MPRRRAWNGSPPNSPAEARRRLLEAARRCLEQLGPDKAGLSDVALSVGVTRQTVYRYFESAEALFQSAAVLSTGGLHQRMREVVGQQPTPGKRIVECLVFCVQEIPKSPDVMMLASRGHTMEISTALSLGFVQEEIARLSGDALRLSSAEQDELAELLFRLLRSFLDDPGVSRSEASLRAFLSGWLVPMIESRGTSGAPTH